MGWPQLTQGDTSEYINMYGVVCLLEYSVQVGFVEEHSVSSVRAWLPRGPGVLGNTDYWYRVPIRGSHLWVLHTEKVIRHRST